MYGVSINADRRRLEKQKSENRNDLNIEKSIRLRNIDLNSLHILLACKKVNNKQISQNEILIPVNRLTYIFKFTL